MVSDPLLEDTDADGLLDSRELELQTNLLVADSDGDGLTDAEEVNQGRNPLVAEVTSEPEPEIVADQTAQQTQVEVNQQVTVVESDNQADVLQASIGTVSTQQSKPSLDPVEILQQSDQNWKWITSQEKNKFTVQLFNSSNLDQTIEFLDSYNLTSDARIVPSLQGGIVYYKVIMGSFDNWLSAGQKVASLPKSLRSTTPLIRTFVSLYPENPHADAIASEQSQQTAETIVKAEEKAPASASVTQPQTTPVKKEQTAPQVPKTSRPQAKPAPAVIIKRAPNIFGNDDDQSSFDQLDTTATSVTVAESESNNVVPRFPSIISQTQVATTEPTQQPLPTPVATQKRTTNPLFDNAIVEKGMSKSDLNKIQTALKLTEEKQYQSAINILTPLANSRNADARYRLALMVRQGFAARQRPQFAFNLAKLAAEQGHPHAKQLVGQFYLQGYGVAANPTEASKWL